MKIGSGDGWLDTVKQLAIILSNLDTHLWHDTLQRYVTMRL